MLVSEVNKELVGKKVSFNFTGLRSTGIVTEIYEDGYSKGIVVILYEPPFPTIPLSGSVYFLFSFPFTR